MATSIKILGKKDVEAGIYRGNDFALVFASLRANWDEQVDKHRSKKASTKMQNLLCFEYLLLNMSLTSPQIQSKITSPCSK